MYQCQKNEIRLSHYWHVLHVLSAPEANAGPIPLPTKVYHLRDIGIQTIHAGTDPEVEGSVGWSSHPLGKK